MEDAKHRTAWQHPDNRGSYNQSDVVETIFFNGDQKKEHVLNHTMLTGGNGQVYSTLLFLF